MFKGCKKRTLAKNSLVLHTFLMVDYVVSKEGNMSFKFAFSGTVAFTPYTFLSDNGMELKFT